MNQLLEEKEDDGDDEKEWDKIFMQSCSITVGDQEVILKTNVKKDKQESSSSVQGSQVVRKFLN